MPNNIESQTQPTANSSDRDAGRVQDAEPRAFGDADRPSDTEAAHRPQEGQSVRDPGHRTDALDNVGRDRDVKLEGAMGGGADGPDPAGASDDQPALFADRQRDYGTGSQNVESADEAREFAASEGLAERLPRDAVATDANDIAADDAGASAMAERAGKGVPEQPQ